MVSPVYFRTCWSNTDHENTPLLQGKNGVKFYSFGPTITNTPGAMKVSASANSGKFSFSLKITDPDTHAKDIKITLATSDSK